MYHILHVNNRAVRGLYSLRDREVSNYLIAIYLIAITPSRTKSLTNLPQYMQLQLTLRHGVGQDQPAWLTRNFHHDTD